LKNEIKKSARAVKTTVIRIRTSCFFCLRVSFFIRLQNDAAIGLDFFADGGGFFHHSVNIRAFGKGNGEFLRQKGDGSFFNACEFGNAFFHFGGAVRAVEVFKLIDFFHDNILSCVNFRGYGQWRRQGSKPRDRLPMNNKSFGLGGAI